jgi:SpoVK/Ycf46/Vps4 family AAA+-type ATPase
MDEAEDVFGASSLAFRLFGMSGDSSNSKSKLFFNRLLESNAVPVIWVSNSINGVDPAHLRRFSYALNMETPDEAVQCRIWNYSARKNHVKLPKEKIDRLVKSYDIAPAIIDASLRTAALTGDHDAIEKTIDSLHTAMRCTAKREFVAEHQFSTALLNCDVDLENLAQQLTTLKGVNFSLCLYGVPGSGKSAYARFLAEQLKMRVLHKRASDLMSMWLGESEKNIAAAFAEAKRKKMLLVIDEADSFLQDRRHAQQSWEVTQVNEMLTQMESHPLPFVCTTNLMDDLDQASLRRFTFKVKYDYLTRRQTESAFKHFFGGECTGSLAGLTALSPGDFAVVSKRAKICAIDDHKELVRMLWQEQDVKDIQKSVGFATN